MSENEKIMASLNQWLDSLDNGDLEGMLNTCDPDVIVCNEHQPTSVGIQAIRNKYAPRIEAFTFASTFDMSHIKVCGDFAIVVGHFSVEMSDKKTGEKRGGKGRLVLNYRRHEDGTWKMLLDVDNNS